MAAGLRVWAPDGTLLIDTATSVAVILGTFAIGGAGSPQSGSISDPRLANGRPYFFHILGGIPGIENKEAVISSSDTTISWSYPTADGSTEVNRPRVTIMFGIY